MGMKNIRKKDLLAQSSFQALTHLGGAEVFLAPVGENQKSALQVYFDQKGKEMNLDWPFEEEALLFLVESLIIEGEDKERADFKEIESTFKTKLLQGFKQLNKSKTARQLMMMVPDKLSVELFGESDNKEGLGVEEADSHNFFVLNQMKKIFIPMNGFQHLKPKSFGIEFLHETGHILDHEGLRPFSPFNHVYKNKENQVIKGLPTNNFSGEEAYRLDLILEAEKQGLSYQMNWESASFFEKMGLVVQGVAKGLSEAVIGGIVPLNQAPSRSLIGLHHGLLYEGKKLKSFLKNPLSFFKKQEKRRQEDQAKKEAIFDRMTSLLAPVSKKKGFLGRYKSLSMLLLAGGPLLVGLSPLLGALLGGGALLSFAGYLKENNQKFKTKWQRAYQQYGLENLSQGAWQENSSHRDFNLVLESLGQKYNQTTRLDELQTAQIDEEGYFNLIESKKCYQSLSPEGKKDLNLLVELFFDGSEDQEEKSDSFKQAKCVQLMSLFLDEEAVARGRGAESGASVGARVEGRRSGSEAGASVWAEVGASVEARAEGHRGGAEAEVGAVARGAGHGMGASVGARAEGHRAGVEVGAGVGVRAEGRRAGVESGASVGAEVGAVARGRGAEAELQGREERFFAWLKKELSDYQDDILMNLKEVPLSKLATLHHKELLTFILKMKTLKKQELNQKNTLLNMKKQSER